MKKQSNNLGKYAYIGAIAILIILFGGLVLEKSQVTDFYTKPASDTAVEEVRPVNDIQYTPAIPTDNEETDQKKQDGTIEQNAPGDPSDTIGITLTAANQDEPGGPVVVRVLISNAKNGSCITTLEKEGEIRSYTKQIINNGTYYSCEPLDIPAQELSNGTWLLTVNAKNSTNNGTVSQNVEVSL